MEKGRVILERTADEKGQRAMREHDAFWARYLGSDDVRTWVLIRMLLVINSPESMPMTTKAPAYGVPITCLTLYLEFYTHSHVISIKLH